MGWLGLIGRLGDWGNDRSLFSLNHPVTMQRRSQKASQMLNCPTQTSSIAR